MDGLNLWYTYRKNEKDNFIKGLLYFLSTSMRFEL